MNLLALQPSLKSELAKAIHEALRDAVPDFNNIPLNAVTIQVEFGVEKKIGAGGQAQFSIVTIGPEASASKNAVQTIKLVFAKQT